MTTVISTQPQVPDLLDRLLLLNIWLDESSNEETRLKIEALLGIQRSQIMRVTKDEITERETAVIELKDAIGNLVDRLDIYGSEFDTTDSQEKLAINAAGLMYTVADLLHQLGCIGLGPNTKEAVNTVRRIASRRNGTD